MSPARSSRVLVVPCSAGKLSVRAPASELYVGTLHRMARAAAEALAQRDGGDVVVFSALHGLIPLDRVIDPYDVTWGHRDAIDAAGLAAQLRARRTVELVSLTPRAYTMRLAFAVAALPGSSAPMLRAPLEGCRGIGDMRSRLARLRRGESVSDLAGGARRGG